VPTTTLVQLSDIHVFDGQPLRAREIPTKRLTGYINYKRKRADEYERQVLEAAIDVAIDATPDLCVVTGDLTNLGRRTELVEAKRIIDRLRDADVETRVIPGNHDYYTRACAAGGFEAVFEDYIHGSRVGEHTYPYSVEVGHVCVVLWNSAVPTWPFLALGLIDDAQRERGDALCAAAQAKGQAIVFALHHHPTRAPHKRVDAGRMLRNSEAFRALISTYSVSLTMHGHNHVEHRRRLLENPICFINGIACSTSSLRHPPAHRAQVARYRFDANGLVEIATSTWDGTAFCAFEAHNLASIPVETAHEVPSRTRRVWDRVLDRR